jgi:predicted DCC family thiol-disulfide oxidoreductase YuxK
MPIILFDGVCNLCNASVNFIIDRDKRNTFMFASLQSDRAQELLATHQIPEENRFSSIILLKNGRVYQKSAAALEIARDLDGLWPVLYGFKIIPGFIRDFLYNLIARNRYRLMGRRSSCRMPEPWLQQKFLV